MVLSFGMGKLLKICTRKERRAPMETCTQAEITFENGVGNDSRGKHKGKRQVTVMALEDWNAACAELAVEVSWTTRRANLLIEGVELKDTTGGILQIGNFQLEITGELVPCERMDEQVSGLTKALSTNWRGGVTCKILSEGSANEGDDVVLVLPDSNPS
ncbi:MAG: MOSC domain-containing protein YiiM [Flavobacteriaceae bacterium]|jgi:MOSC domain-containing protein YiiM